MLGVVEGVDVWGVGDVGVVGGGEKIVISGEEGLLVDAIVWKAKPRGTDPGLAALGASCKVGVVEEEVGLFGGGTSRGQGGRFGG